MSGPNFFNDLVRGSRSSNGEKKRRRKEEGEPPTSQLYSAVASTSSCSIDSQSSYPGQTKEKGRKEKGGRRYRENTSPSARLCLYWRVGIKGGRRKDKDIAAAILHRSIHNIYYDRVEGKRGLPQLQYRMLRFYTIDLPEGKGERASSLDLHPIGTRTSSHGKCDGKRERKKGEKRRKQTVVTPISPAILNRILRKEKGFREKRGKKTAAFRSAAEGRAVPREEKKKKKGKGGGGTSTPFQSITLRRWSASRKMGKGFLSYTSFDISPRLCVYRGQKKEEEGVSANPPNTSPDPR